MISYHQTVSCLILKVISLTTLERPGAASRLTSQGKCHSETLFERMKFNRISGHSFMIYYNKKKYYNNILCFCNVEKKIF